MDSGTILAALTAVGAATVAGQVVEHLLNRRKREDDENTALRKEIRAQDADFETRLDHVQTELDHWRDKYYELLSQFHEVKNELAQALIQIRKAKDDPPDDSS